MQQTFYLGIDLGTTNSAACLFDGERLDPIRSGAGEVLTPSVVRIDARSNITVGSRAHRFLHRDPKNTRSEFKRLMGSKNRCHFAAASLERTPEELSALVLSSLRKDVESQAGFPPARAVIAVPALFELPQIAATCEAARLAGFERIETIQEPVASALASGWSRDHAQGAWLVYDLGGGTFDVSLLETQEGLLRVVGHDGDNFLGGRDFDLAIVDWLIAKIRESTGISIERSSPEHASVVAQLKVLAEEAKIEVSRGATQSTILVEDLGVGADRVDLCEAVLSRDELEALTRAIVERSIKICERLLRAHGVRKLERIVLVGGPTMMPWLRLRLEQALGASIGTGLDPMLLVAQGAALFAATAGLDAKQNVKKAEGSGPRLWLQYPAMTADTSPFVVGRVLDEHSGVSSVRFSAEDRDWTSDWIGVEPDGTFAGMLSLKRRAASLFRVDARLSDERIVEASPHRISVVHGVSIGDPPLARTIGVARSDDTVAVYIERGSPLPMRKTFTHRTVENLSPKTADFALRVPIVQGDFPFAHLCRLVGVIEIPASALKGPLPAGSVIELTLEIDRGGALSAKACLPTQHLVFDHVEQLVAPATSPEAMSRLVPELVGRAGALRARGFRDGERGAVLALADFEEEIETISRNLAAARGGDQDAAEKARRALIDCDALLGDMEAANAWPELTNRAYEEHSVASYWLSQHGSETEKRALAQSMTFVERALRARNSHEVERQLRTITRLRTTAYLRAPEAWSLELDWACTNVSECSDPGRANRLIQRGREAESTGNRRELERAVRELWTLFPANAEERRLGFDSGVK